MNRKEALKRLKNIRNVPSIFIDETIKELVEVLEKPITLADLLGWEEGQEYEYRTGVILMLDNEKIFYKSEKCSSGWCNYNFFGNEIEDLRQATKVETKLKAYHVKDEYSYNCLMKELEEQGYDMNFKNNPLAFEGEIYIFEEEEKELGFSIIKLNKVLEKYDLIEYHKEEPKFYAELKVPAGIETHSWLKQLNYDNTVFDMVSWFQLDKRDAKTKTEWSKLDINNTNVNFREVKE